MVSVSKETKRAWYNNWHITKSSEWSLDLTKRNLGARLKGAALKWNGESISQFPRESYHDWKAAFITKFTHPAEIDRLKIKFNNLKQKEKQLTQSLVDKIVNTYKLIYGDSDKKKRDDPSALSRKNDVLLGVFLKGLKTNIKDAMYGRLPANYKWEDAVKSAVDAENLLFNRELNDTKTINNIDAVHQELFLKQQQSNDALKAEIKELKLPQAATSEAENPTVANVNHAGQGRGNQGSHHSQGQKNKKDQGNQQPKQSGGYQGYQGQQGYYSQQRAFAPSNDYPRQPRASFGWQHNNNYQSQNRFPSGYTPRQQFAPQWQAPGQHIFRGPPPFVRPPHQADHAQQSDNRQCYNCGAIGHITRRCPQPRKNQGGQK